MKSTYKITVLLFALGFSAYSCSEYENPVAGQSATGQPSFSDETMTGAASSEPVRINNYDVQFNGKSYDANSDRSTFSYTVSGTGIEPALNNFFLETPSCAGAPVAFSPTQSAKVGPDGITWESSVPTNASADYSVTYSGDLPVGFVDATVESGNDTATMEVPGPCKGIYTISGSVYVDGNTNQLKDLSESGLRNVTVQLTDGAGQTWTRTTTDIGSYLFTVYTGSSAVDFTVEVPPATAEAGDFNEQLFDTYTPTTDPPSKPVTVNGADVSGTDFGFAPQTQKLIQQFEDGTIALDTEEPKFWIKQLRFAKKNNKNAEVSAADLNGYLAAIEELLLEDPFQFGDNKIDEALDVLTRPIRTDLESLLVQLLTAELNVLSGRGSNSLEFDLALLAYGEAAAFEEAAAGTASLQKNLAGSVSSSATVTSLTSDAESLLTSYNFSGGGGGVGN